MPDNLHELANNLANIHNLLLQQATKAVNVALTVRNWLYGYFIHECELGGDIRAQYGEKLIENLAKKLKTSNIPSSSHRNLKLYRQFYQAYPQIGQAVIAQLKKSQVEIDTSVIGQSLLAQLESEGTSYGDKISLSLSAEKLLFSLAYSHFIELMKIDDHLKQRFYELECVRGHWSTRELKRQISSLYFERSGLSKNKKKLSEIIQKESAVNTPQDIIRDPYVFEFLDIKPSEIIFESKLADGLVDKLQKFLLELGKGFCFEARNKRILIGDEFFFIDLVFYHRVLKCHAIVELKTEKFNHENIGQLNTYLNYYKKHEMSEGDNPPIGILLCTEKNHALVEYAIEGSENKLFVSKYELSLPTKKELKQFVEKEINILSDDKTDEESNT